MLNYIKFISVMVALLFVNQVANAKDFNFQNYDIKGFKPGINKEDVYSYIQKNNILKLETKGIYSSRIAFFLKDGDAIIFGTTGPIKHEDVYYVSRAKEYAYSTGPLIQNLKKSLLEKYGLPTIVFYNNHAKDIYTNESKIEYYWEFDQEGNLKPEIEKYKFDELKYKGRGLSKKLESVIATYIASSELLIPPGHPHRTIYKRFDPVKCGEKCGYRLSVAVITNPNESDNVVRYSITLANMSLLGDVTTKARNNLNKRIEDNIKKARKNNMQIDL